MKPVLIVENVSKKYSRNIYAHRNYGISDLFAEVFGRKRNTDLRPDEFWAVKDVSFTLYSGESLALVGRNGSGKSTLLKMLNGLIKPDTGKIIVEGKVQALINLGAGFDKSLSGKENIFNAAALMGLSYSETKERYGEIVDFADLGEFIDSPVGTYSSGMYARLGFSVAIHLNPQIILIDEILAVGDHAFQNKCFVKMHQLKQEGVTMLLVSHSLAKVTQFCDYGMWIDNGKTIKYGNSKEVVKEYISFMEKLSVEKTVKKNSQKAKIAVVNDKKSKTELYGAIYDDFDKIDNLKVDLLSGDEYKEAFKVNEEFTVHYQFDLKVPVENLNVSLNIYSEDGLLITTISTLNGDLVKHVHEGKVDCKVTIDDLTLNPGKYVLVMPIHEGHSYLYRNVVKEFTVISNGSLTWGMLNFKCRYEVNT